MNFEKPKSQEQGLREFDRLMLRSKIASIFWSAISRRKASGKFKMQQLADSLGRNKSTVSRWFSDQHPNWEIDTIADIAGALDLELEVVARERQSKTLHTVAGVRIFANANVQVNTGGDYLKPKSTWTDKKPSEFRVLKKTAPEPAAA